MQRTSDAITTTTQASSVVSYAMAHNRVPVVDEVVVTSAADLMGAELHVDISDVSGVLTRPCRRTSTSPPAPAPSSTT